MNESKVVASQEAELRAGAGVWATSKLINERSCFANSSARVLANSGATLTPAGPFVLFADEQTNSRQPSSSRVSLLLAAESSPRPASRHQNPVQKFRQCDFWAQARGQELELIFDLDLSSSSSSRRRDVRV